MHTCPQPNLTAERSRCHTNSIAEPFPVPMNRLGTQLSGYPESTAPVECFDRAESESMVVVRALVPNRPLYPAE